MASFSLKHPEIPCVQVSAKTGNGVSEAFATLTKKCIGQFGKVGG